MLAEIGKVLRDNPTTILGIYGHVDALEQDTLAMERCEAVKGHLIRLGVHEGRLVPKAFGKQQQRVSIREIEALTNAEEKKTAHSHNRRVEFLVLSFDWVPEE